MDTKEIAVIEKKVNKLTTLASEIKVVDETTMANAGEFRLKVKTLGKEIAATKEAITKPLNESLKNIRALFAPIEEAYEQAEQTVSKAILDYQKYQENEARRIRKIEEDKLEQARKDAEKGKISEKKLEQIETKAEAKIINAAPIRRTETFSTRTIKKVRIINESIIPREYLVPDMVRINQMVKAGANIPGCELYEENTLI